MFGDNVEFIYICVVFKSNGIIFIVIGLVGLFVFVFWFVLLLFWLVLVGIFIISVFLIVLLIGYFKVCEFEFSLEMILEYIIYCYRLGCW